MPSKSPAQKRLMQAAAHTKGGFGGVPQKVGKEFVNADKRTDMKKAKKMADGGMAGLGSMISSTSPSFGSMLNGKMPTNSLTLGRDVGGGGGGDFGGGGGSAQSGLQDIGRGAGTISQAINQAASRLTGGGGGGGSGGLLSPAYKKGGSVTTTRRVSTGSSSKKSNW